MTQKLSLIEEDKERRAIRQSVTVMVSFDGLRDKHKILHSSISAPIENPLRTNVSKSRKFCQKKNHVRVPEK